MGWSGNSVLSGNSCPFRWHSLSSFPGPKSLMQATICHHVCIIIFPIVGRHFPLLHFHQKSLRALFQWFSPVNSLSLIYMITQLGERWNLPCFLVALPSGKNQEQQFQFRATRKPASLKLWDTTLKILVSSETAHQRNVIKPENYIYFYIIGNQFFWYL